LEFLGGAPGVGIVHLTADGPDMVAGHISILLYIGRDCQFCASSLLGTVLRSY
jgi:hypothetical protein